MGIVIRQSFWGVVFGYLGVLIGFVNAVILMPKFMTPEEIGLWRTLAGIAAFATPFVLMGTPGILVKFLPNHNTENRKAIIEFLLLVIGGIYTLSCALGLIFRDNISTLYASNEQSQDYLLFLVLLLFSQVIYAFLEAIARANLDITNSNFIREIVYKILHLLIILLFGLDLINFEWYLQSQIIIFGVMIIGLSIRTGIDFNAIVEKRQKLLTGLRKEILVYGFFAMLNGLGIALLIQTDKLVVAKYLGLVDVAIYTTALYMTNVISIPGKYVSQIASPLITRFFQNNQLDQVEKHYKSSAINQTLFASFIFFCIYVNLQEIFELMPNGDKYKGGTTVFIIIGITKVIENAFGLNGVILNLSKYYKFSSLFILITGICNFVLNLILIKSYGIEGAAYATFISFLIFNLLRSLPLLLKYQLQPFNVKSIFTLLFLVALFLLFELWDVFQFKNDYLIIGIGIKLLVLAIGYFIFVITVKPSTEVSSMIKQLRQLINKSIGK